MWFDFKLNVVFFSEFDEYGNEIMEDLLNFNLAMQTKSKSDYIRKSPEDTASYDDVSGNSLRNERLDEDFPNVPGDVINPKSLASNESDYGGLPDSLLYFPNVNKCSKRNGSSEEGSPRSSTSPLVVLFTHLSSDVTDAQLKFALSSIKWWVRLEGDIKIVIFVAKHLRQNALLYLRLSTHCEVAQEHIVIVQLEASVLNTHIAFNNMFQHCYSHFDAFWYAYADYGVIFDASFETALKMLKHSEKIASSKGTLVLGQSHAIEVHQLRKI